MDKQEEKEDFSLKMPSYRIFPLGNIGYSILSLIISGLLLSGAISIYSMHGVLVLMVLSILVFIIITSISGDGVALSLPSTTYPLPSHLGHGGVSLEVMNSD
tara:strand:- start:812 stop:1117 length:306 start_codon:yes stop_codon:yes gene_type:complete